MKGFNFKYLNFIDVNLELKQRYTIINGNSATGKSYFYDLISQYIKNKHIENILCFNAHTDLSCDEVISRINNKKDAIIIIDMADSLFEKMPALKRYIEADRNNYYVLMSRTFAKMYTELAWINVTKNSIGIQYKMDIVQ